MRKLLRSKAGAMLSKLFQRLHITETAVLKWSTSPTEFFQGLNSLVVKIQEDETAKKPDAVKDRELRALAAKNKELVATLQSADEHKTKAVMRLAATMARYANTRPNFSGKGAHNANAYAFLTARGDALAADSANEADPSAGGRALDLDNFRVLNLSQNGIEDTEAIYLAKALKDTTTATELNLNGNRIRNDGLTALVLALLSDSWCVAAFSFLALLLPCLPDQYPGRELI